LCHFGQQLVQCIDDDVEQDWCKRVALWHAFLELDRGCVCSAAGTVPIV
jgi:hypothetical protein